MAVLGDTVDLECTVEAQPEPKMLFWKDASGWMPVIQGGQYNIHVNKVRDVSTQTGHSGEEGFVFGSAACLIRLVYPSVGGKQVDYEADH